MLRNRMLVLVGGCLLTASAAWADGVAYVDCASHPEDTQVFGKPRRTPDVVASLACGERFTILQNGFIFSRIQTKDGKVGYVYSNLISADHSGASVPQPSSTRPAGTSNVPANVPAVTPTGVQPNSLAPAQASPAASAQPQAMPAGSAPTQAAAATSNPASEAAAAAAVAKPDPATSPTTSPATSSTASSTASPTTAAQSQSTSAQAAPSQVAASSSAPETSATVAQPSPTTPAQTQEVPDHLAITETAAPTARVEAPATATQPEATSAAQPEPAPAEPAASAVRPVKATESWEKPNAGVRTVGLRKLPLIELFGGYGFARFDNGGGTANNLNGVVGSFGWNVRPWLQLVADSSYSVVTGTGIKDVLYGNHYGPRVFLRRRSRWGATPFVEGLVGGSRADTTITGTGGYTTSANSFSFKLGGGLDIKPSRRFEIRLFDADYYRTSFGPNVHQNNYWVSTGIVLRFFGRSE
jgi:hypothetical protein